jgi:hypothetical protein
MSSNVARVEPKQAQLETLTLAGSPMGSALVFLQNGGNIEQLNQMMDLQARWEANQARKAFTVAMTGFKAEPVTILKKKNVRFETRAGDVASYNHAELSDVTEGIGQALAKHELSYRWNIRQEGAAITVDCILTHVAGHSETVTMTASPDNSGMKNAIQQVASTTTYLQRYTLLAITGMSTKGMDNDGRVEEAPVEVDGAIADWIAAAEAIVTLDEYATRKAELLKHYGEQRLVPKPVQAAFAAKNKQLQVPA